MMHLANHQETEPHCTDPASLADDLSKYWAGWNLAASMESVTRLHQARDLHMGDTPLDRGFRDMTFGDHEGARHA